jgi:hypothetical protein
MNLRACLTAEVYAETLLVLCPVCKEALPDPEYGSEFWEWQQIAAYPVTECKACQIGVKLSRRKMVCLQRT